MATGDYCTLDELKARIWPDDVVPDDVNDAQLAVIITATSRWIDNFTGTRFYSTAADETRYYTAEEEDYLSLPDDVISITTLTTDAAGARTYADSWTAGTDYDLLPFNYSLDGLPARYIMTTYNGSKFFPTSRKSIKIVGKFGYCATGSHPSAIKEACLLQCARIWKRQDVPFSAIPTPAGGMGPIPELDSDVKQLLDIYRRFV
ncbi:MAG: hypothetical protein KKH95_13170 [Gammaproteobacteria bacterium]|nr:hypothetical protein [Gammaproteobacteria bacterium]